MEDVLLLGCTESFSEISELAAGSSPQQQQQQQQQGFDNIVLVDSRSYEDPVLVKDQRILANILDRQNDLSVAASKSSSYFDTVQTELKPHMRKIVSDWMLEVGKCEENKYTTEYFTI